MVSSSDYTQTTFKQAQRGLELLGEVASTNGKFQNLIGAGDLLKAIAECPDLSRVDREAVLRLFKEPFEPADWTNYRHHAERLMIRSRQRDWGLGRRDFNSLARTTAEEDAKHGTGVRPIARPSVDIWLGSLRYTWDELYLWLKDEAKGVGLMLRTSVDANSLFVSGEGYRDGDRVLRHAYVDVDWLSTSTASFVGAAQKRSRFEVLALLAMNPQLLHEMGRKLPIGLIMDGLGGNHNSMRSPYIHREDDVLRIDWFKPKQ